MRAMPLAPPVPYPPGCYSAGDTFDEALASVKEAIDLHAQGLVEDDRDLPAPRDIAEHQRNPDYAGGAGGAGGVCAVVEVELYASWPDMPLPALGDRTPREAVKDPLGRQ